MFEDIDYKGLTGIVITPGDQGYEQARQEYNRAIQKFPFAIVYCLEIKDVSNAVRWARRNRACLRIRSGRHNYEGYSTGNGVLVVDMSRLNAVKINKCNRTVELQGGALNRQLAASLSQTEYSFPIGSCPTVGAAGYAMGGGWNYFCRYLGLGCDSLTELRMVNCKGEILTASERCNPDLFWACRGSGGGNFGIVVSMTFQLSKKVDRVTYFEFYKPQATSAMQASFLSAWQSWLPDLDRRMTLRPSIYSTPEEGRAIFSRGIFFGTPEDARQILKPLLMSAELPLSTKYVSFTQAVAILGSVYPPSEQFKSTGRFAGDTLSPQDIESIVGLLGNRPEGIELIEFGLFALGGKVDSVAPTATAYFYRDASYIFGMQAVWTDPQFAEAGNLWVAEAFHTIEPLTQGSYVNFPYDELEDYELAYYGGNVPRLRMVKKMYDPENVFSYPQSIRP